MLTAQELLQDRLSVVMMAPEAAHAWHRLYHASQQVDAAAVSRLLQQVRTGGMDSGLAGVLAGTFLHALTDQPSDLAMAADAFAGAHLPLDAGLAILHTVYAMALRRGASDQAFLELLTRTGFLTVTRTMAARLHHSRSGGPVVHKVKRSSHEALKLAVVAPSLSTTFHAPSTMALQHARLLAASGCRVSLFGAQEFQMLDMGQWLGVPRVMNLDHPEPGQWSQAGFDLPVVLAPKQLLCEGRWRHVLRRIDAFEPDAVFFIGPYSPLLEVLYTRYPVLGLGTNALAPVGPVDLWLAPKSKGPEEITTSPEPNGCPSDLGPEGTGGGVVFPIGHVSAYTQRFAFEDGGPALERQALQLPNDACVWVTVGTRLHTELTHSWVSRVREALNQHPQARWLLVGQGADQLQGLGLDHPQIVIRPFERQIGQLFKACNLYLNPPRRGGGHSVACAMFHGLPVLSTQEGDGGDKVGCWGVVDEAAYFEQLSRLCREPQALRTLGKSMRERFQEVLDMSGAGGVLLQAARRAWQLGARRLRQAY